MDEIERSLQAHWTPCRIMPLSKEPQMKQNVGLKYVWGEKTWVSGVDARSCNKGNGEHGLTSICFEQHYCVFGDRQTLLLAIASTASNDDMRLRPTLRPSDVDDAAVDPRHANPANSWHFLNECTIMTGSNCN